MGRVKSKTILAALCLATFMTVSAQMQPLNINTTGQDWGVLSAHPKPQAPNPSQTQSPCLSVDPHCTECSNNVCTACNIIFTLDNSSKKCVCPDNQKLSDDGSTCINMALVNVGKALYNNTAVQDSLYKATMGSVQRNKAIDSFVANTALSAANFLQKGQTAGSTVLAAALAPIVQPAQFIAAPKEPLPDSAPAPEADPGAAVAAAGQPLPAGPALAPKDAEYYQLLAEGKAQQAQERLQAQSAVLQASGLAPAQAIAPTVASVAETLQQLQARQAAAQQQQQPSQAGAQQAPAQTAAVGTPSGLNPISALVSQAGGLLQSYLPGLGSTLGRRLLREWTALQD